MPGIDRTIALGARKPAHCLLPAAGKCGRVVIADIGLMATETLASIQVGRPQLRRPGVSDTKYTRGKLLVIGGAMPGAAALTALAGQRAGAGYVELLGPASAAAPHALVTRPWDQAALTDPRIGAIVVGPGLGRDGEARARLDAAVAAGKRLVIDADALTLIGRARHDRLAGHVITPHDGEYVRLFGERGRRSAGTRAMGGGGKRRDCSAQGRGQRRRASRWPRRDRSAGAGRGWPAPARGTCWRASSAR